MKKRNWILAAILALALFLSASYAAAWLLIPPRGSYGSTWESYLQEPENSVDVLFFGSSLVYCNVVPAVIYEETGVTSYVMAGPEQTLPLNYAYIKEALRTQDPKVAALEITGMFYPRYCDYSKVNVSYMPWSANRLAATFTGAERELWGGLLFPLWDYHSRWREVTTEEIRGHISPSADLLAGYTWLDAVSPQSTVTERDYSAETENYARNLAYLARIAEFCEAQGTELMLFITPTKGRIPAEALETLRADAAALGLEIRDFNEDMGILDIDDTGDWFDFLHFNHRGAEKFTRLLSAYLTEAYALAPTEGEDEVLWQQRTERFAALCG